MRLNAMAMAAVLCACGGGEAGGPDTGAVTTTITTGATQAGTSVGDSAMTGDTGDTGDTSATTMTATSGDGDTTSGDGDSTATTSTGDGDTTGDGDGTTLDPPRDALMKEFLDDALARAAAIDSGLALTQINGFGIDASGRVGIDGDTGFLRRWNFGFHNPGTGHEVSIIYMSETWAGTYPQVEDPAGNVVSTDPIVAPTSLPDSDTLAAAYSAAVGCAAMTGAEADNVLVRYEASRGVNVAQYSVGGSSWGADLPGLTQWYGC